MYNIPKVISDFHGEYYAFSNFFPVETMFEGDLYGSTEAAFQAAKTLDKSLRTPIIFADAGESKRLGRKLPLREDWETVKYDIMEQLLIEKFTKNDELKKFLEETKGFYLLEGNVWHDNCWGHCFCKKCELVPKTNHLGRLLMKVRNLL